MPVRHVMDHSTGGGVDLPSVALGAVKERHRNKELVSMRKTTEGLDGTVV
jgi:hypothetical protein